jgi:3',5'-cyclic-AMP phosphodiesterase
MGASAGQALRIAQVSDIHCGTITFDAKLMEGCVAQVNEADPDLVIVAGDLTAEGYRWEFEEAADWLARFAAPTFVIPGNHDARNIGWIHFRRLFGERFPVERHVFDAERAARIDATGVTVVGVDSSQPDLNEGRVGREWYGWIRERFERAPDDLKVFVVHHHLISIPGTGRERSTVIDAGMLLQVLAGSRVDVILSGHKHVPFFWGLNGMLVCNSGTASTWRVRGLTPPSWNEITIDASSIKVHLHYEDGRRELAVVRTRANWAAIREALYVTEAFHRSNPISLGEPDLAAEAGV